MKFSLSTYHIWELGQREKQEDSIFPTYGELSDDDRLFILCDGMGGHGAGDVASNTVCKAMSDYIMNCTDVADDEFDSILTKALNHAYDMLDSQDNGSEKKMGTTLTLLKFHNNGCTIAHIGDSRVYHIRPGRDVEDTQILFQTLDHSLVNDLIRLGEITPEEAKTYNQRNVITRAMQAHGDRRYAADIYHTQDIQAGDCFLLCSDGILEQMEDNNIKYIFSDQGGDASNKINIIKKATANNNDNHSAILVHVRDVDHDIVNLSEPTHPDEIQEKSNTHEALDGEIYHTKPTRRLKPNRKGRKENYLWLVITCIALLFASVMVYLILKEDSAVSTHYQVEVDNPQQRSTSSYKRRSSQSHSSTTNTKETKKIVKKDEEKRKENTEPPTKDSIKKEASAVNSDAINTTTEASQPAQKPAKPQKQESKQKVEYGDDVVDSNEQKIKDLKKGNSKI